MKRVAIFASAWIALVFIPLSATALVEPDETLFIPLGDLPGGRSASSALGVAVSSYAPDEVMAVELDADDGADPALESTHGHAQEALIVGESSSAQTGSNAREAFAWNEDEGMVGLSSLPGGAFQSRALAISRNGRTIVGASSSSFTGSNGFEAFRLDAEGVRRLGDLPGGPYRSEALGVSLLGDFVVGASSSGRSGANSSEAFVWSEEDGIAGLGSLAGGQFRSAALGISDDGMVIAGWSSSARSGANASEAFMWTEDEGILGLGSLSGGAFSSDARAISAEGTTIVGASSSARSGSNASEAFAWNEDEGMFGLGFLPGGFADSEANGVTDDGKVVVGRSRTPSENDAFVWDEENGMRSISDELVRAGIDLAGWRLLSANAVVRTSDVIVVVGNAINPQQREEAFIATLPEPAGALAQGIALLTLSLLARRAR